MEDIQMEDNQDLLLTGNMFEELGIDLLNVKELGIDMTSIPVDLWNKKAEKPIKARLIRPNEDKMDLPPILSRDLTFKPFDRIDPTIQIGLLQAFYTRKAAGQDLIEVNDHLSSLLCPYSPS